MKSITKTADGMEIVFLPGERNVLVQLVAAVIELLTGMVPEDDDDLSSLVGKEITADEVANRDPAIRRLFPAAYSEDEADIEFRKYSETDAAIRKHEAAEKVWQALREGETVTIPPQDFDAWLRTLTNIRLILAERDISDLEDIFEWTGWLLEILLEVNAEAL